MRIAALAALLFLVACKPQENPVAKNPDPAGDPCGDPEKFVRSLFAQYDDGAKPLDAVAYFDDSTMALVQRDRDLAKGELPSLDYDPVCNCQDWENLKVTEVRIGRDEGTTAGVAFQNGGKTFRQDFALRCTSNGWKVHDITVRPDNTSLRAGLTKAIEEASRVTP